MEKVQKTINLLLRLTGIALLLFVCPSCDPAISVVIRNKTSQEKHIHVIYPAGVQQSSTARAYGDSLPTFDLAIKDYEKSRKVIPLESADTTLHIYSFVLQPGYEAVVESRSLTAWPTFGQVFIIDHADTLRLEKRGKDFRKRPSFWLGGTWQHEIK